MSEQPRDRRASSSRNTKETQVEIELNLDGKGAATIATGVGFLDHMLTLFAKHGLFDLRVQVTGDLHIDEHHTVEDTAIVLGQVFLRALGDARGIQRVGHCYLPMDETLARVAVDLSGRPFSIFKAEFGNPKVGDLSTDLIWHFFQTFASEARLTLHAEILYGANDHHRVEALFKALARSLSAAVQINPRLGGEVPSTKGMLAFSEGDGETNAPKKD